MDLTKQSFLSYLPWLLNDLSSSCFVAFDLELSGIALNSCRNGTKSQTLQQRYEDIKAAAEKYHILQIGLTICREDPQTQTYILKPYNINLSPIVSQNLKIDRDWIFRSSSADFLLRTGFSIDAVCEQGVRYLSRDEEIHARDVLGQRFGHDSQSQDRDIQVTRQDTQDFIDAVRCTIDKWVAQGEERWQFLNIPPPSQASVDHLDKIMPQKLSNLQKRLVHQVVGKDYPDLRSRSDRVGFVQITYSNPEKDKLAREGRLKQATAYLVKDIGFRWIIEALAGGDLTGLNPLVFAPLMPLEPPPGCTLEELTHRLKERLKANRAIMIGHNCLTDLVYIYRCFIGPLPATVEEFQTAINGLFPVAVDTKYMATHGCSSMNPASSLEEENRNVAKLSIPKISVDTMHTKYAYQRSTHEAGYDSMLTAVLFIRLSAYLHKTGKLPWGHRGQLNEMAIGLTSAPSLGVRCLFPANDSSPDSKEANNLGAGGKDDGEDQDAPLQKPLPVPLPVLSDTGSESIAELIRHGILVPRLGSAFWQTYGNELRVFGTETQVMQLDGELKKMDDAK